MRILERPNGLREGYASLANIGYHTFEVSLDGEVVSRLFCRNTKLKKINTTRFLA